MFGFGLEGLPPGFWSGQAGHPDSAAILDGLETTAVLDEAALKDARARCLDVTGLIRP
jgi:hypothetical protein